VSVVGDDHAALGPEKYLDLITENHQNWGSKISLDKHAKGTTVKFCEEVIMIDKNFLSILKTSRDKEVDRNRSLSVPNCLVDTFKLRYLSPFSKSQAFEEDSNPVFGKGKALFEQIRSIRHGPLKSDGFHSFIVDRFKSRMRKHLPSTQKQFAVLTLPGGIGGIGMFCNEKQLSEALKLLHDDENLVFKVICKAASGELSRPEKSKLLAYTATKSRRGHEIRGLLHESLENYGLEELSDLLYLPVPYSEKLVEVLRKHKEEPSYNMYDDVVDNSVITDIQIKSEFSFDAAIKIANQSRYVTEDQFLDALTRGVSFNEILSGSELNRYKSIPWSRRYSTLIESLEGLNNHSELTSAVENPIVYDYVELAHKLINAFSYDETLVYLPTEQIRDVFCKGRMKSVSLDFQTVSTKGLPCLRLPNILKEPFSISAPDWAEVLEEVARRLPYIHFEEGSCFHCENLKSQSC
jgi:hypothetical protein